VVVLSYIPLCAPLLMPIRIAMEAVEPWQVALSLALSLAVIPLLVMLGGRIYSNAVLRTGSRVRLRDALRKA
jgi:ABC-2 type transport system permease protein